LASPFSDLRDRIIDDLERAHDYYEHTKVAWEIVEQAITQGQTFSVRNLATGTLSTHADLAGKARVYLAEQLPEATFQEFISLFEYFFGDFLRLLLMAYPKILGKKELRFEDVLLAPDVNSLTQQLADSEIAKILYRRPADWFKYLEDQFKLGCPTQDEIERFAEAKSSRDMLVHNLGRVNQKYLEKSGSRARYSLGQQIEITAQYHRETWELTRNLVEDLTSAAIAKLPHL